MCGVFGISYGPLGPESEDWTPSDLMAIMFPAIIHRGHHAWGYMTHSKGEDAIDYFKKAGSATHRDAVGDMILNPKEEINLTWLAGHVRYATKGLPSKLVNNHPILHGNIVGMHNGVLRDYQSILDETGREDPTALVDSEAIFAAVNKWGVIEGLKRIKGDMVSVFADTTEPDVLYIARTHGRPLFYGHTKSGSLIWASEAKVIEATGIEVKDLKEWHDVNKVMRVHQGKITNRRQFRKPDAPVKVPTRHYTPPTGGYAGHSPSGFSSSMYREDEWGGTYLGSNMWKVPTGERTTKTLNAAEYIRHILEKNYEREVNRRLEQRVNLEVMRRLDSLTQFFDGKTAESAPAPGELDLPGDAPATPTVPAAAVLVPSAPTAERSTELVRVTA